MKRNQLLEEFKELIIKLSELGEYVALLEFKDSRPNISKLKNGLNESVEELKQFKRKVDEVRKDIQNK